MGKLRTEPKVKTLDPERYKELAELLQEAQDNSHDNNVFYDLEDNETSAQVKKDLSHVAEKEGIGLKIRHPRKSRSLQLLFNETAAKAKQRLSADDAKELILGVLSRATEPLKKSQILAETGVSTSSWNMRIRELIEDNRVSRQGNRRDTVYTLVD